MTQEPRIAPSARRHGIKDHDMLHAFRQPIAAFDLADGLTMLVGGDTVGRLLEVGVVAAWEQVVIVHAMTARARFLGGL